jgi:predicted nucleotidyltransferase
MILKNTKLKNELKKFVSGKEIDDILVFGSTIRGKEKPNDLDLLVVFNKKVDKEQEQKIKIILKKHFNNISIISKTKITILDQSFDARESVLFEATSLLTGSNLAKKYGFISFGMFKYDFSTWNKLQKTKFYYALNGRGSAEGIFQKTESIKLSDQIVLVPLDKIELFREFLESWKLDYKYVPMIIPERLGKKRILGK